MVVSMLTHHHLIELLFGYRSQRKLFTNYVTIIGELALRGRNIYANSLLYYD